MAQPKTYTIDLELPENERWAAVIEHEKAAARRVLKQALGATSGMERWIADKLGARIYELSGGLYVGEIEAWGGALGVSQGVLTAAQCAYELSMGSPWEALKNLVFGCTAAVVQHPTLGPTHVRHLDWPLSAMGKATRLFRFRKGDHEFVSVGVPGFVGVLSGYVPGGYSVTINQAPASETPTPNLGAAFLLREVLTDCRTYDEAVYSLCRTPIAAPVFFMVCGTEDHQACVIERRKEQYTVRKMGKSPVLAVTNHHEARGWSKYNLVDQESMDSSCDRYHMALDRLEQPNDTLRGILGQMKKFPIYNDETVQRMVFNPRGGKMFVAVD